MNFRYRLWVLVVHEGEMEFELQPDAIMRNKFDRQIKKSVEPVLEDDISSVNKHKC